MKLDTVRTVPSMYSPFLGLASPLFLDPAIYPSPIHTSPDVCLSSGPASTLPKALLDILPLASRFWRCPFPGTFFIAHTLPQVLWPQVLGRLLDHSLLPQWALLAHYLQPRSPWCKELLALSPAVPISENRLLPVHGRDWVRLDPAPPHPRAEAGKYNSLSFSVAGFFI